jgi:cytochrome c oxidase cbb3-type subunit 3/ubiquinol-cytochrome c reductase cytochrome c subunit
MRTRHIFALAAGLALPLVIGCELPGRPRPEPEVPRPESVISFDQLYAENCSGCHGKNGDQGPAANLANPEYQALIDDASLRDVIVNGEKGTLMPGFGSKAGGTLTDQQIEAIVQGIRARWKKDNALAGQNPPPYKAVHPGDQSKGQAVYAMACAHCHGEDTQHRGSAGSILDGSFLALINEQTVRTTIIAGRPDVGEPDWRNHIPGRPMTDDEITNVSAWLIAQRPAAPGQPYPNMQPASEKPGEEQPKTTAGDRPSKASAKP